MRFGKKGERAKEKRGLEEEERKKGMKGEKKRERERERERETDGKQAFQVCGEEQTSQTVHFISEGKFLLLRSGEGGRLLALEKHCSYSIE